MERRRYMTPRQVAEHIGCDIRRAHKIMREAGALRLGARTLRVHPDNLELWQELQTDPLAGARREAMRIHNAVKLFPCPHRSSVYFIQSGDTARVKIGVTQYPRRLLELQIGNPDELFVVAKFPGDSALEEYLHAQFDADRLRGEWFTFSQTMQMFVQLMTADDQVAEAAE
jgi:hypothetical protein